MSDDIGQSAATDAGRVSDWIPVSERLPGNYDLVLAWDGGEHRFCWYAIHDGGLNGVKKGSWYETTEDGFDHRIRVTHWMPLPAAPDLVQPPDLQQAK